MDDIGSRAQVWHEKAKKTTGGLEKKDLIMVNGRIKSKKASNSAKKNNNLLKAGWTHKKGEFGAVRISEVKAKKKSKKTGKSKKSSKSKK